MNPGSGFGWISGKKLRVNSLRDERMEGGNFLCVMLEATPEEA